MDPGTHIIDPDGEVMIVLQNANAPFAQPDEATLKGEDSDVLDSGRTGGQDALPKQFALKVEAKAAGAGAGVAQPVAQRAAPSNRERSKEPQPSPAAVKDRADSNPNSTTHRIQVSAKHLTLASPYFKNVLTGGWKESRTFPEKGFAEITADGWNLDAFLILLRAIHSQNHLIPERLDLETLAQVALIADYYDCKDVIYVWGRTVWLKAIQRDSLDMYSRELVLSLWISWFFRDAELFTCFTSCAMSTSRGRISVLGLPVPIIVVLALNKRRETRITSLFSRHLEGKREQLLAGKLGCGFECSSIMYGALTKEMQAAYLLSVPLLGSFQGRSYRGIVGKIRAFRSPKWQNSWGTTPGSEAWNSHHKCPGSSFSVLFGDLKGGIKGLVLATFLG
ncbi:hypothetical protein BDW74DRAFT_178072 [Aspergillus multicolor]|uniref:BTB/POZ domain-containing protein n=1 Tax=Aspergillus multicolor TaxID=41759 RepID=UPI003CCC9219